MGCSRAHRACAVLMFLVSVIPTAAEEKWSDWMFTNDAGIEWRWIGHTYGPDIAPDCVFEFRNKLGGKATFKFVAGYSWPRGGILDQKKGTAYQITDTERGGDSINKCTRVLSLTISDVKKTN